jgi:hypothetical protein
LVGAAVGVAAVPRTANQTRALRAREPTRRHLCRSASESEKHQLALAISPQAGRLRPDPSQDVPPGLRLLPLEAYRRSHIGADN